MNRTNRYRKQPQISVIIINRNGKSVTKNCLDSLLKEQVDEVIIVDNNSTDGSLQLYDSYTDPRITIVENEENKGYAEANNQGYYRATGSYIVFLNNDTIVTKNFLEPLISRLKQQEKLAAVQPLIVFPDKTIDSVGSYVTPTGFLYHRAHRQRPSLKNLQPAEVYTLKGACMVWKKQVLEEIGVFEENYFAYFEETDLCNRAIRAGYTVEFVPKSVIIHLGGFTSNSMDQTFIQYHNTKNRIFTYLRHLPNDMAFQMIPIHLFLTEVIAIHSFLRSPNLGWAVQRGLAVGLLRGFLERVTQPPEHYDLWNVFKKPDFSYYKALFSSLKNFDKLW